MSGKIRGLKEVEQLLQQSLTEELQLIVPLRVHCAVREQTFLISIHVCESSNLSPALVLPWVEKKIAEEGILRDYPLQTYFIVHDKARFETLGASALVPLPPSSLAPRRESPAPRVIGWGLIVGVAFGAIYALSRPCLWGDCPPLERAQQLQKQAMGSLHLSASYGDAIAVREDISHSLAMLGDIPPWSPYYKTSSLLIATYQQRSRDLDRVIASLETAAKALTLTEKQPLNRRQWQESGQLWRSSIENLAKLPSDSQFYPLAREKTREYRKNVAMSEGRIDREQRAEQALEDSQKLAQMAILRQKTVLSLSDWEWVEKTWQAAIERLRAIPSDTGTGQEARRLMDDYLPRWAMVRASRERESLAIEQFQRAIEGAKRAENAAQKQNWSESAQYWQNSLALLQQIPRESLKSPEAARTLDRYQRTLQEVRSRERMSQDLARICEKTTKICTYELGDERIRVYLTATYTNQVRNTAIQAQTQANMQAQLELMNHLSRLESVFQTMSDSIGKTVEVYNFDRVLMAVYDPKK